MNEGMMQVRTNPDIHGQRDGSGQHGFVAAPFVSVVFSVSFSLARACFSESETLCINLTMASSELGQKHSSFNTHGRNLPKVLKMVGIHLLQHSFLASSKLFYYSAGAFASCTTAGLWEILTIWCHQC